MRQKRSFKEIAAESDAWANSAWADVALRRRALRIADRYTIDEINEMVNDFEQKRKTRLYKLTHLSDRGCMVLLTVWALGGMAWLAWLIMKI